MKRKKNFKTIRNNPNMGLHDSVCKNKVGYCTKKDVFLNGQQISIKMCGCKNYNEETNTYTPCSYFIDKNKKPKKFQEKVDAARNLHSRKKKVNKNHCEIVKREDINGNIVEEQIPLCQSINLQDKFKQVMEKNTCKCNYNNRFMGEELCKKRGCRKGKFGKLEGDSCPYLVELYAKPISKKCKKKKEKESIKRETTNTKLVYKDNSEPPQVELKDDEIILFGQVFKKGNIGMDRGENFENKKDN